MKIERSGLEEIGEVNVVIADRPGQISYAVEVFQQVMRVESEKAGEVLFIEKHVQGDPVYETPEIKDALMIYNSARRTLLKVLEKQRKKIHNFS